MSQELNRTDAKAFASSYVLTMLLHHLDKHHAGLINALIAGVEGDLAAVQGQGHENGPGPVPSIFQEALSMLHRAGRAE